VISIAASFVIHLNQPFAAVPACRTMAHFRGRCAGRALSFPTMNGWSNERSSGVHSPSHEGPAFVLDVLSFLSCFQQNCDTRLVQGSSCTETNLYFSSRYRANNQFCKNGRTLCSDRVFSAGDLRGEHRSWRTNSSMQNLKPVSS